MSFEEVQKDANIVRSDTSNQMARAMEDFKAKVGNELVPVLARNIGNFATLADKVAYVTGVFAEHPGKVIAGFIGLSTALGVAQSALGVLGGSLLDRLIPKAVTSMNVAAGTVVVGGAGAAAGTAASTAASGAGTAAAGAGGGFLARNAAKAGTSVAGLLGGVGIAAVGGLAAGYGLSEWYDSTSKDRRKGTQGAINDSFGLSMKLSQGKGTAADVQKAQEVLARLDKAAKPGFVGGVDRMLGDDHAGRAGGAAKELREALAKAQVKLDPGVTLNVNITNAADIANATNAQKPKAQGID
jgi:hypothetical protein